MTSTIDERNHPGGRAGVPAATAHKVTNKHSVADLRPADDLLPLQTLCDAGIREIMIVTAATARATSQAARQRARVRPAAHRLHYQEGEGGIADRSTVRTLRRRRIGRGDPGDNIVQNSITRTSNASGSRSPAVACCSRRSTIPNGSASPTSPASGSRRSRRSQDPQDRFGDGDLHVRQPGLRLRARSQAVVRGELEITDVNNAYIAAGPVTTTSSTVVDRRRPVRIALRAAQLVANERAKKSMTPAEVERVASWAVPASSDLRCRTHSRFRGRRARA